MLVFNPHHPDYPTPLNSFQKEVFDFCQQWNLGKNEFLFHTSGSTGKPKPIYLTRSSMIEFCHVHPVPLLPGRCKSPFLVRCENIASL
jgi:acyl-CoA synthetase (AMP-forming)/AMP-acid ligase II